jgi:hypothetical protein
MRDRTGPGPTLRTVLQTLNARGYHVGLDDDGHSMLVMNERGRRSWLGYGPVMCFFARGDDVADAALTVELNAFLDGLPDEWAPPEWCEVGVEDADLAWQLERFGVRPMAYVLARLAGLRDLPSIAAQYGLPSPSTVSRDDA